MLVGDEDEGVRDPNHPKKRWGKYFQHKSQITQIIQIKNTWRVGNAATRGRVAISLFSLCTHSPVLGGVLDVNY